MSGPRLNYAKRASLCQLLADLLQNGFNLRQTIDFMTTAKLYPPPVLALLNNNLEQGFDLAVSFYQLGYTQEQVAQLELAGKHGGISSTLAGISRQMQLIGQQRKKFYTTATYPVILLLFLLLALLGMRFYLVPQILSTGMVGKESPAVQLILRLPYWLGSGLLCFLLVLLLARLRLGKLNPLQSASFYCRIPLIGPLYRQYLSAYFSLEWGKLFLQGMELQQIIVCLSQTEQTSLLKELALELENSLKAGESFAKTLSCYPFFSLELSQMVLQGEAKGQLGKELLAYSELLNQRFFHKVERWCSLFQPLVFLFVALLIVGLYAAMLLPLYGSIEGGI